MKPLAATNRYVSALSDRKQGVERNVRSSSALEGISAATFRSAAEGALISKDTDRKTPSVNDCAKKN